MLAQRHDWRSVVVLLLVVPVIASGCSSVRNRDTVSPYCFPNGMYGGPRSEQVPINLIRLRQDPPPVYILAPNDTLGIYIEGVLGNREEPPPVHFQQKKLRDLPPAIGYPIPIREDGTLPLPLIPAIQAEGLTIPQLESVIRDAYVNKSRILAPGRDRIIVTLMQPRNYKVVVVREDIAVGTRDRADYGEGEITIGSERTGAAKLVELPAYENDVLHALSESGGLPGLNAKNEVVILRGSHEYASEVQPLLEDVPQFLDPNNPEANRNRNVIRIPLRAAPGKPLQKLDQDEIILNNGDIIYIQSRDAEVFYTGGLLEGGQHAIPRDFDLDVFGAMAMAGGSVAASAGAGVDGRGSGVGSIFPPTRLLVLRMENGRQHVIRIDLKRALSDPAQRILIKPDDFIVLEYTPTEVFINTALSVIRINVSLNELFN